MNFPFLFQTANKMGHLSGIELVNAFHLVSLRGWNRVSGDNQEVLHLCGAESHEECLGGVQISVSAGQMWEGLNFLPPEHAGYQAGIHPCLCRRAVRNGNHIGTHITEALGIFDVFSYVRVSRWGEFHGNGLLPLPQLSKERALFHFRCRRSRNRTQCSIG